MKHILLQVLSNVEGITNGCDVAKLTWNRACQKALFEKRDAFVLHQEKTLVEMVFKVPMVSYLEAPDTSSDVDLEEAFDDNGWIVVNDSFVKQIPATPDPEIAGTFLVVFDGGFKWRTYLADSEVILETVELPWSILDTEV